jgi:hypothetical protein
MRLPPAVPPYNNRDSFANRLSHGFISECEIFVLISAGKGLQRFSPWLLDVFLTKSNLLSVHGFSVFLSMTAINSTHSSQKSKTRVAVFFGGRSPEHDVSIVTGLQVLGAIDSERFETFPLYISPRGEWYVGDALRQRSSYMLKPDVIDDLMPVTLEHQSDRTDLTAQKKAVRKPPANRV